jgi:hypothetical protein
MIIQIIIIIIQTLITKNKNKEIEHIVIIKV